jgi:DNA-binding FadR family transcriptional regulator
MSATELSLKAPAALAEQLRESILAGKLTAGTQLPAERVLAERSQVSRSSVREALRILEAEGLIVTRPGRKGGPVVVAPAGDALTRPLETFIRTRSLKPGSLYETLLVIEPAIARLAATNRTDEDLALVSEAIDRYSTSPDREERLRLNAEIHVCLAAATGNELLTAIVRGLRDAIHASSSAPPFAAPGVREKTIESYATIFAAIEARDADAAEKAMRRHIVGAGKIAGRA